MTTPCPLCDGTGYKDHAGFAMGPCACINPKLAPDAPRALAAPIIVHLLGKLRVQYLALLLKGTFWHANERRELFRQHRPARLHALTWRPDFLGLGAPTMECMWVVWQHGWASGTHYHLMPRDLETDMML